MSWEPQNKEEEIAMYIGAIVVIVSLAGLFFLV